MDLYGSMFDYIGLVSERIEKRFSEPELKSFNRMLEIIENELMPEVSALDK